MKRSFLFLTAIASAPHQALALQLRPSLAAFSSHASAARSRVPLRAPLPLACERELTADEKRVKAERLALQAERAALEAEELELKAQQLKLESQLLTDEADQTTSAGDYTDQPCGAASGDAKQGEGDGEDSLLFGLFNVSADALPPPPPLTYGSIASVVERSDLSKEAIQLSEAQIEACKERVFNLESFYVMNVDQTFLGTVFRGNLRTNSSIAYERVMKSVAKEPSLNGVQFLLLDDPMAPTMADLEAGVEERRPVFLALPAEMAPNTQGIADFFLALVALFGSFITTLGFALSTYLLADGGAMLAKLEDGDIAPLDTAFPIAIGLFGLQLVHELAHLAAASKNGLKLGVPLPLPSLQLGFYGCITRLLAFAPSRQGLFEFAFAGPAVGFVASLALYLVGIGLSVDLPIPPMVDLPAIGGTDPEKAASAVDAIAEAYKASGAANGNGELYPVVPAGLLESSALLGTIATLALPALSDAAAANSQVVAVHPLAIIGFIGALTNALQLVPIGRLDGGRVAHAVLGQQTAGLVSGVSLLLLGLSTIFGGDNPILLFFGLLIIFFQRAQELPCLDDLTGVSDASRSAAAVGLLVCLLVILPLPGSQAIVASSLNPPGF